MINTPAFLLFLSLLFVGCNDTQEVTHHHVSVSQKGYFVVPMADKIQYQCGKKSSYLDSDGMFVCQSFPVTFYVDSQPIGSIDSLHDDGYVFPQDIINQPLPKATGLHVASW